MCSGGWPAGEGTFSLEKELAALRHLFLAEKVPPPPVRLNLRVAGQALRETVQAKHYTIVASISLVVYTGTGLYF